MADYQGFSEAVPGGCAVMSPGERLKALLTPIRKGSAPSSVWLTVPDEHLPDRGPSEASFVADAHYFVVRVRQMHLAASRQWFATYDPLLFVQTEFSYDGGRRSEPFVAGPDTLHKRAQGAPTPAGVNITDLQATGVRPYRGGDIELSVVLCRNKTKDAARRLLSIAERCLALPQLAAIATVAGGAAAALPYVQVAEAGLDALEAVLGLDEDVVPMLGSLHGFDSVAGIRPGWFVLAQAGTLKQEQLWVRDGRLWYGPDSDRLVEPAADFVLCSLGRATMRDDATQLSGFQQQWKSVLSYANQASDESWEVAKALLAGLRLSLLTSADLTSGQARELARQYQAQMVAVHEEAVRGSLLEADAGVPDPLIRSVAAIMAL